MTPGSAVRLASVARHVTDYATRPDINKKHDMSKGIRINKSTVHITFSNVHTIFENSVNQDQLASSEAG